MKIEVHDPMILLKFAEKMDDRKFRRIAQIAKRTYFFGSVIFMNLLFWV